MKQSDIEMADMLRESGKIYAVIAVIALIFFSIIVYLIFQDRKIKQLDKKLEELEKQNQ
ncbi:MAG: hypothetical protein N2203_07525 [Bacteroidia bacterium]|nr:hypothetical protein [Bacteroidia bacterium]